MTGRDFGAPSSLALEARRITERNEQIVYRTVRQYTLLAPEPSLTHAQVEFFAAWLRAQREDQDARTPQG